MHVTPPSLDIRVESNEATSFFFIIRFTGVVTGETVSRMWS